MKPQGPFSFLRYFARLGIGMLGNSGRAVDFGRDLERNERFDESQTETHRGDVDSPGDALGPGIRVTSMV